MLRLSLVALSLAAFAAFVACGETLAPSGDAPSSDASSDDAKAPSDDGAAGDAGDAATGCSATACPETLATLGMPVQRVVVFGDWIYVVRGIGTDARLVRLPAPFPAVADPIDPAGQVFGNLATDSTGLYWGALDGIRYLAHGDPATAVQPVGTQTKVRGITRPSGTSAIWFTRFDPAISGGYIGACTLADCALPGGGPADYPSDIVFTKRGRVDMGWANADAGKPSLLVQNVALGGVPSITTPTWLASDGEAAYVAADEGLLRATPDEAGVGGVVEKIFGPSADRIRALTTDGLGRVFYAQNGAILVCTIKGNTCAPKTILALSNDTILDVVIADGFYYWGTQNGLVQRVARE